MKNTVAILFTYWVLTQSVFAQTSVDSRADLDSPWKSYRVEQFSDITDYIPKSITINKYGSNTAYRSQATGFFRIEQLEGRWFIIDPEGYAFIHKGVACVAPGTSINQKAAVVDKWGNNNAWTQFANGWLKENGFNGAGAWSDVARLRQQTEPVVYTVIINPMSSYRDFHRNQVGGYTNAGWQGYEYNIIRVFDPQFENFMDNACKTLAQYKDDKYLLGYFVDNELPWVNDALDRHLKYLPANDPGYIAAKAWLDQRKGKDAALSDVNDSDRNAFWDFYAGKYFKMAKDYITQYDTNHLFLGSRFNQGHEELSNPYIFSVAGQYCDVISINHYREWEPIAARMANWEEWAQKPFLITEFYTKGEDSGFGNTTGAGWLVKTQRDRGLFYQNFVIKLLRSKGCVGWNWFRYQDNDPEDPTTDPSNRDSNKGLVNITYDPYADLMDLCKITNDNVYSFLDYLKTIEAEEQLAIAPEKDTYVRLLSSEADVHGKETLLRVKNSNGTTYERTAFLQFDFSPYLNVLSRMGQLNLNLKLLNVYPGAKDPASVIMNAYRVTGMTIDETLTNTQFLAACQGKNETFVGSVTIPVGTQSANSFFGIDITSILSELPQNPVVVFRLQMNVETETQFEFASRENTDAAARPYIGTILKAETSIAEIASEKQQVWAYKQNNYLVIDGLEINSLIKFYNLNGRELCEIHNLNASSVSLSVKSNWGNLVLVKITGNKTNETLKVLI
jgi:hypothetical protein